MSAHPPPPLPPDPAHEPPGVPGLRTWPAVYLFVFATFVAVVAALTVFTLAYR